MRRFADSADVPSTASLTKAQRDGVTGWAGYLRSPYATHSWTAADLRSVAAHIGGILPVYVGPYDRKTLAGMNPTRDAGQAASGLLELAGAGVHASTVCLDIERGAWDANPADVLHYFATFAAALAVHRIAVVPYGCSPTLIGLGQHDRIPHVWAAAWELASGKWPRSGWPTAVTPYGLRSAWAGARAWQFAGNVARYGMRVDCSVADPSVPFAVVAKPAPAHAPAPAPKPPTPAPAGVDVTLTVGARTYSGHLNPKG